MSLCIHYAVWQQSTYEAWRHRHEEYWKGRLIGAPKTRLPSNEGLVEVQCPDGATLHVSFGSGLSDQLRAFAQREGTLLQVVILAVYAVVMSRWCSQNDVVLAIALHGCNGRPELENMIGYLANFIYLRLHATELWNFIDLLKSVHAEFTAACLHQDLGRVPDLVPGNA